MLWKVTDRNNVIWRFEDENHVREVLKDVEFNKIEVHYFTEAKDELASPQKFNLNDDEVDKLIDGALVGVISIN